MRTDTEILIDYTPRAHVPLRHEIEHLKELEASQGYCAVFQSPGTGHWKAYRATPGGSTESSPPTRDEAVHRLTDLVQDARALWDGWITAGERDPNGCRIIRCKHVLYTVQPTPRKDYPRRWWGHGGRRFRFRMHDGVEVETDNLWFQGDIPTDYRDQLLDNAVRLP